jgi:hypothetical protein
MAPDQLDLAPREYSYGLRPLKLNTINAVNPEIYAMSMIAFNRISIRYHLFNGVLKNPLYHILLH